MTRIVSFADSFTSSSAPVIQGAEQEDYIILNNQAAPLTLFTIDASVYKSAFMSFELERIDVSNEYRQTGTALFSYDGTNWIFNLGSYQGDDFIVDTIANTQDVKFEVETSIGVLSFKYTSGNMSSSYSGTLKTSITRIVT